MRGGRACAWARLVQVQCLADSMGHDFMERIYDDEASPLMRTNFGKYFMMMVMVVVFVGD